MKIIVPMRDDESLRYDTKGIDTIIIKNSDCIHPYGHIFYAELGKMFQAMTMTRVVNFLEQSAMEWAFECLDEWKGLVKEIPAKSFNSYISQRAYMNNAWTPDDLIIHFAGMTNGQRIQCINALFGKR